MTLKAKTNNFLSFFWRFGLSAVLLVYLFNKMDIAKTLEIIKTADSRLLYLAGGIFLTIHFLLLLRWYIFIKALHLKVTLQTVTSCFFIGLFTPNSRDY